MFHILYHFAKYGTMIGLALLIGGMFFSNAISNIGGVFIMFSLSYIMAYFVGNVVVAIYNKLFNRHSSEQEEVKQKKPKKPVEKPETTEDETEEAPVESQA